MRTKFEWWNKLKGVNLKGIPNLEIIPNKTNNKKTRVKSKRITSWRADFKFKRDRC
jgi:hypothetical protein